MKDFTWYKFRRRGCIYRYLIRIATLITKRSEKTGNSKLKKKYIFFLAKEKYRCVIGLVEGDKKPNTICYTKRSTDEKNEKGSENQKIPPLNEPLLFSIFLICFINFYTHFNMLISLCIIILFVYLFYFYLTFIFFSFSVLHFTINFG